MLYMHLIFVALLLWQQAGSCSIRDQCVYTLCIAAMRCQVLVGRWNLLTL